jgi:hypothetical protein
MQAGGRSMVSRFVVSLTVPARRAPERERVDLAVFLQERFRREVRVLERGFEGKSVTVEMADSFAPSLRRELPFATVEPQTDLQLLSSFRS